MGPRLSADERRVEILRAAERLFAEKGFHGATTRDLADAAGVSEALIFKYFPTKERLYADMQAYACQHCEDERAHWKSLPPSTTTLAILVHRLMTYTAQPPVELAEARTTGNRLMLHSLLSCGTFARLTLAILSESVVDTLARNVMAAAESGDCDAPPASLEDARLRAWTAVHAALMTKVSSLPERPVVDYGCDAGTLVRSMARFCLRGLGLSEAAIARTYQPDVLAVLES
ncbi:MAG: helix-turn-helix transcriptional regulator [Planctomycetes bacterium]|nr:helix-turn-helix transcriptional regulator [Planctomycetota bacterium]